MANNPIPGGFLYDVFMSHASEDKGVVGPVVERLRASGLTVWYDETHITGSPAVSQKINDALDASRVLVYCLSKDAVGKDWVHAEVGTFAGKDPTNKTGRLVVLALDSTPAPGTWGNFKRIQWSSGSSDPFYIHLLAACQAGGRSNLGRTSQAATPAQAIEQEFGFDTQVLARLYVEPNLQDFNPPDIEDDPGCVASEQPAVAWVRKYVARDIPNENGARILFILGDAGMGKTSLLIRLKCLDLEKSLRLGHRAELMRLNCDTLTRILAIPDPIHTLLLLDSLDEDPEAHHARDGADTRLRQLFPLLERFFRVVITCRTQFFPKTSPHFTDRPGWFSFDSYSCPVKYLSFFDDDKVEEYLRKRFRIGYFRSVFKQLLSDKPDTKLKRARAAAAAMDSLRMRPLLLSYIEAFVIGEGATQLDHRNRYAVYDFLVSQWLQRERQNNKGWALTIEEGWRVATAFAIHLTLTGRRQLPQSDLLTVPGLKDIPRFLIESRSLLNRTTLFDFQFAHTTFQEFLVARALLNQDILVKGKKLPFLEDTRRFLKDGSVYLKPTFPGQMLGGTGSGFSWAFSCELYLGIEMIDVSPGTFQMGSPMSELGRDNDEGPQHSVAVTHGFWLGKFAVTQKQYQGVMGTNPSRCQVPNHPVDSVTWHDAIDFCKRLTTEALKWGLLPSGWECRLPTEAEWEYACRAGTTSGFNNGAPCTQPMDNDPALGKLGWFDKNSRDMTHPVGEMLPNKWGFYDFHGNVMEWCMDGQRKYRGQAESDPFGPFDGPWRGLRGGSYWFHARYCWSAARGEERTPDHRNDYSGFRLAAGQRLGSVTAKASEL